MFVLIFSAIDHDIQVTGADLRFLPIKTRVPLKFGAETLDSVTCARARVQVLKKTEPVRKDGVKLP